MNKEDLKQAVHDSLVALTSIARLTPSTLDDATMAVVNQVLGNDTLLDLLVDLLPVDWDPNLVSAVALTPGQQVLCEAERIDLDRLKEILLFIMQILGLFLAKDD